LARSSNFCDVAQPLRDAPSEHLSGRLVAGRYQLGEMLGKGGFGAVYAGRDTDADNAVAVKVFRRREGRESRAQREARTASKLEHPNVHNVLGVRGYTIEGDEIELGGRAADGPGLDLLALTIGSEGLLMIVTEIIVRLIPRPACVQLVMASFADVHSAGNAVAAVIAAGIIPAALEMMDRKATAAVEPFARAGYDLDAAAILLVESDGAAAEVAEQVAEIERVLRTAGASTLRVSASEAERQRWWSGRKNAFPAAGRLSPDYYCMDGTIPRKHIGTVLEAIEHMELRHRLRCMNVFHAGDGNLHPVILFDANDADSWERAERFGAEILELCVQLGGTITGEHGVGVEKLNSMCVQFSPAERAAFAAVKESFDPYGLLNPGKVIPTLARCAEYGRMRVHHGELAHAELPRF